jgi:hypothetical protein
MNNSNKRYTVTIYTRYGATTYRGSYDKIVELREVAINAGHGTSGVQED